MSPKFKIGWLLRGMWDFPGPGIEPVPHALAGGFFFFFFNIYLFIWLCRASGAACRI